MTTAMASQIHDVASQDQGLELVEPLHRIALLSENHETTFHHVHQARQSYLLNSTEYMGS
jgi:hypothetical protein